MNHLNKFVPTIADLDTVVHGLVDGNIYYFPIPTLVRDIKCAYCGGNSGYTCLDYPELREKARKVWFCENSLCFARIAQDGLTHQTIQTRVSKLNLEAYGCLPEHRNAELINCDLSLSQKSELSAYAKSANGFLLFSGIAGVGKTYTACAVLRACLENNPKLSAKFCMFCDFYYLFLEQPKLEECTSTFVAKYAEIDVLVLDDMGMRAPTDPFLDVLFSILSKRLSSRRSTIITTNYSAHEIGERFTAAVLSRLTSGILMKLVGKDKRTNRDF